MKRKPREKYTEEDILRAVADIKNGICTYRTASEKYRIPVATLCNKVKGKVPLSSKIGKIPD